MVYPKKEIEAANERGAARLSRTPTATAARYDRRIGRWLLTSAAACQLHSGRRMLRAWNRLNRNN
jgi:hypothetical protein